MKMIDIYKNLLFLKANEITPEYVNIHFGRLKLFIPFFTEITTDQIQCTAEIPMGYHSGKSCSQNSKTSIHT